MIINTTSQTIKNIWVFFLLIFVLAVTLFIILSQGIRIDSLTLPKVHIEQLYIKLDKKLIVYAKEVDIDTKSKGETSLAQIYSITNYLDLLHGLFSTISIQNLNFKQRSIHFLYKDEIFYIDSDLLTIDAQIRPWRDDIELVIKQMLLKDYALRLKGNLNANFHEDLFRFQGTFSTFNIKGSINARLEDSILYYRLASKKFDNLSPFMEFLATKVPMERLLKEWIYKRIVAKEYELSNLQGKINMKDGNFYPSLMEGSAKVKDAKVEFHKDVPKALIKDLKISLKDDTLYFHMKDAFYEGKNMDKSDVHIYNLMTKGAGIIIDLKTEALLDNSIQKILYAFGIQVPIIQTKGSINSNVILDILFDPYTIKSYIGLFEINGADFELSGLPMHSQSGTIRLDNDTLHFDRVNLKYTSLFDIYTSGVFELKKGVYKAKNEIKSLDVNFAKSQLLKMEDFQTNSTLKLEEDATSIFLDDLNSELVFAKSNNTIKINDLNTLKNHSPVMKEFALTKGSLTLNTEDFTNFSIDTKLYANFPLEQNGNRVSMLPLHILTDGKELQAKSKDGDVSLDYRDNTLTLNLKNHDILFDSSSPQKNGFTKKIEINGINSSIKDTNSSLFIPADRYTISVDKNKTLLQSKKETQESYIKSSPNNLYVNSTNISSEYINALAQKTLFHGGSFDFYLQGESSKNAQGFFTLKDTTLKEGRFYNNLMAFFNTIPSLLTFKNPGFNDKGYGIEKGFIDFDLKDKMIHINSIKFDGKSTDIDGKGEINLQSDEVNIDLKIAVLKNFSSAVKNIPIVNYILLGDDGKMYTNVKITGSLDDLQTSSKAISDAAFTPFEIIKRTLKAPFQLFE